ncbi:CTL-like protein 2, partial [Zootermopsis nevadensis]
GECLKYDPTFKGPLHKRSCTDVICLLLFIFFIAAWIAVGTYAFMHGDPARLLTPTDSEGRRCGLDVEVRNKPSLFYFDLTKCAVQNSIINGCPTPQVCVEKCPTINFAFITEVNDWTSKMICKEGVTLGDRSDAEKKINANQCAGYYLQSKEVYGRCLPGTIDTLSEELQEVLNKTQGELEDVLVGQSGVINIVAQAKELGQKIVQDLSDSWPFIIGGLVLAMLLCLVYIVLMRWFAGVMVWLSLVGVIALLSYCCYASYVKYDEMKTAEESANSNAVQENSRHSRSNLFKPVEEELNEILAMKDTWLAFLIISAIILVVVLLLLIFLRSRIRIAIALIKEASKWAGFTEMIYLIISWCSHMLVKMSYISVATLEPNTVVECIMCFLCLLQTGDKCDPFTFAACSQLCHTAVCQFFNYEKENYVNYLHAFNIFGIFWGLFFVSALGEIILAATFATWYWTFNKSDVPFFVLTVSIGRTLRYHLGTIAFGSLILAICRLIRVILEYINHKLKKYDNAFVKAIMCCLRCFFWCLEKFIKFINKNAYIMCAIHGKNFCRSAKDAFNLLMRNVIRVFVLDKVKYTDYVQVPMLNYSIVPVLIIGFGTYFIATIFFGVYEMAVDTLFLCFLEDCERNDGSREKPYFMSKNLMNILHKKNK